MNIKNNIVTLEELANRLRLSKRWLHQEAKAGRIPSLKAGYRRLFNIAAVTDVLGERASDGDEGGDS